MANVTRSERERVLSMAAAMLPGHDPNHEEFADLVVALERQAGISHERAKSVMAKAIRRRRGEQVRQRQTVRYGIALDDDSQDQIAAIEAATGINGASAVVREALKRMAEGL